MNVRVQSDDTGAIVAQCEAVPLAKHSRCRRRIVGVPTEYQLAASGTEPLATIAEVAVGQTVKIIVQRGVNGSQQGVASEPSLFNLPAASTTGYRNLSATEEVRGHEPGILRNTALGV